MKFLHSKGPVVAATFLMAAAVATGCRNGPDFRLPPKENRLVAKYGRPLYSEYFEELIIRDFFGDRRGGFFVDVGAGPYKANSTTYFLESHLGWTGIAVDARSSYAADYARYRKGTRFFAFFVSDESDENIDFYVTRKNDGLSSTADKKWAARDGAYDRTVVPTITLDDLLGRAGITSIDFLSMDVELAEPAALAGFDIERFRPALVCVEIHEPVRRQVLDYFARHGYHTVETYKDLDFLNLYFAADKKP